MKIFSHIRLPHASVQQAYNSLLRDADRDTRSAMKNIVIKRKLDDILVINATHDDYSLKFQGAVQIDICKFAGCTYKPYSIKRWINENPAKLSPVVFHTVTLTRASFNYCLFHIFVQAPKWRKGVNVEVKKVERK